MGIESDQLVYDYLSRVGDLAQQRQLPASDRMKLVSTLRDEIDRRRATHGEESPSAVRGILGALGTPDEVVERADPGASALVPEPRKGDEPVPAPSDESRVTDWWRADDTDDADGVLGFVGGLERPDLFSPPPPEHDEEDEEDRKPEPALGKRRRLARILRRRSPEAEATAEPTAEPETAPAPRPRLANPFVLLAALLLLGGAAFSSLIALAAGWLLAYGSRRLTPGEIKAAVLVIPGAAAASGAVWLWGRVEGRWGAEVAAGGEALGAAISETWPWVLRGAAITSALFLLWRSRRH
ncbi:hypothetical protein [Streptomyces exfoliatus]|uniref:hypothetical protein n=1 Tax=Streptomyces exfoliatus TaxID=1905 RepID=UPI0004CBF495|nr:hypothetical protein [Streptomyces exfoliatus]